jgi:hypothetical protein
MRQRNYKRLLEITDAWFTLGLITEQDLPLYGAEFETSGDKNSEHYRYGAFRLYLSQNRPLAPSMSEALYELGAADPDRAMGGAMMADILHLPECPPEVVKKARQSGIRHLIKLAGHKETAPRNAPTG